MKFYLIILLILHGIIHFMGFAKAFGFGNIEQLTKEITKPVGLIWLLTGVLFIVSAGLNLMKKDSWAALAIIAVILSQLLISTVWKDAKFGSIANIIILAVAIIDFASVQFEKSFKTDVSTAMKKTLKANEIICEKDLEHLPLPVKKYLEYVGAVGKPKIHNVKISFEGAMRDKGKDWFKFSSVQYSFSEDPARFFFMKAKIKRLPTYGYHAYKKHEARMQIKLLSLYTVVQIDGSELFTTETVTFFNDLCLFAPTALIDSRIAWEHIDDRSVKATFTNKVTSIIATLHFNETGQLVNFVSEDRTSVNDMKTYPFSTPVANYQNVNGYNLPTYGEAVWHYPDGEFVYGKFNLKSIEYNVSK